MTSISRPCARLATSEPTLPRPITPNVLPRISVPRNFDRVHSPRLTDASACGTQRASANNSAMVCSAAAMMLPRGAFTTTMPFRVAVGTSMLSTPTPARPTTRGRPPRLEDRRRHTGLAADHQRIEVGDALDQLGLEELADHCDLA